jgi:hypothetical protein
MRIELFNNLLITCARQPVLTVNTNRLQSLLAYLLLNGESAQSREQLAYLLWPESSESQARTNLRQLLHHLRRALPAECCHLRRTTTACNGAATLPVRSTSWNSMPPWQARRTLPNGRCGSGAQPSRKRGVYQDDLLRSLSTTGSNRSANITAASWDMRSAA